jgi:hypothetical protein
MTVTLLEPAFLLTKSIKKPLCILKWWMRDYAPTVFNNFTIISVHRPTKEKDELIKDTFHKNLNQIYQRIPTHDLKL